MGAGGSAQNRQADGSVSYVVNHKGKDCTLALCTECSEIRYSDGSRPLQISYFDVASWASSPSSFAYNMCRSRPGKETDRHEIRVSTLEAAAIAGSMGTTVRSLQAKMLKLGVADKEVKDHMKAQREEFDYDKLGEFVGTRKFTSIQVQYP